MKFLSSLLSESSQTSTMRVMALFSLGIGAIIGVYGVYTGKDLSGLAQVCGVFVGAAFAAKMGQKYAERNNEEKNN